MFWSRLFFFFFPLHISRGRADRKEIKMRSETPCESPSCLSIIPSPTSPCDHCNSGWTELENVAQDRGSAVHSKNTRSLGWVWQILESSRGIPDKYQYPHRRCSKNQPHFLIFIKITKNVTMENCVERQSAFYQEILSLSECFLYKLRYYIYKIILRIFLQYENLY